MKKKIMWGCGGLFGATVLLTMIAAIVFREPSKDVQKKQGGTETKQAEQKATPEEEAQRELYEQRQREREFAEQDAAKPTGGAASELTLEEWRRVFPDLAGDDVPVMEQVKDACDKPGGAGMLGAYLLFYRVKNEKWDVQRVAQTQAVLLMLSHKMRGDADSTPSSKVKALSAKSLEMMLGIFVSLHEKSTYDQKRIEQETKRFLDAKPSDESITAILPSITNEMKKAGSYCQTAQLQVKNKPAPSQMQGCQSAQGRSELLADEMMRKTESAAASVRFVKSGATFVASFLEPSQKANLDFFNNTIDIYKKKAHLKFGKNWVDTEDDIFEKRMSQFTPGTPQWSAVWKSLTAGGEERWLAALTAMKKECGL